MSVASIPREPWFHGRKRGVFMLCLALFFFFHALHAIKDETSVSRMLQECLVYETPWCTRNRAYLTNTQIFSFVEVRALRGDLSMACHVDGMT